MNSYIDYFLHAVKNTFNYQGRVRRKENKYFKNGVSIMGVIALSVYLSLFVSCTTNSYKCDSPKAKEMILERQKMASVFLISILNNDKSKEEIREEAEQVKIESIVTKKIDKEIKKCECEATVNTLGIEQNIQYSVQENSEGEVIVKIYN